MDVLYHYDTVAPPPDWTDWNGPLTSATNHIIAHFISDTIGVPALPHHALLIALLSLNAGRIGLGILDPPIRAIPDFMLTFTFTASTRHATNGIYLIKHLNNVHLHPTIAALYSTTNNPHSLILKRLHHILPNPKHRYIILPTNHPPRDLTQYFLTLLSPHSALGRLKKHSTAIVTAELYNHVFEHENEHFHLLPSILTPHTSYPLIATANVAEWFDRRLK